METDHKSDEDFLNALVDGELSAGEHAAAAARLRGDRDFARAYATLTKLKASIAHFAESVEVPAIDVASSGARDRFLLPAAAALLMLAIVTAGLFAVSPQFATIQPTDSTPAPVVAATFAGEPVIPDLSAAGLQLTRTVVRATSGGQSLVATYVGPRGCRVELWVRNASAPSDSLGGTERRNWRVGGLVYELVAYGMPAVRFEKVAEAAEDATRAVDLPEDIEQRLIEARISTTPCVT